MTDLDDAIAADRALGDEAKMVEAAKAACHTLVNTMQLPKLPSAKYAAVVTALRTLKDAIAAALDERAFTNTE